jgi:hypothetical protein
MQDSGKELLVGLAAGQLSHCYYQLKSKKLKGKDIRYRLCIGFVFVFFMNFFTFQKRFRTQDKKCDNHPGVDIRLRKGQTFNRIASI